LKGLKGAIFILLLIFLAIQLIEGNRLGFLDPGSQAWAQAPEIPGTVNIEEDIAATRHNLSSKNQEPTAGDDVTSSTSEVCVFCHTPHGSTPAGTTIKAPIWNRNLDYQSTTAYVLYDQAWSFSFEGKPSDPSKPTGYSRLCLSCHDGTIALGSVINKPGSGGFQSFTPTTDVMSMQNAGTGGIMPSGTGPGGDIGGDTRLLGTNLQNDHPISFIFDSNLAVNVDAELVDPGPVLYSNLNAVTPLAPSGGYRTGVKRFPGNDPSQGFNMVQCTSCHNPHAVTYPKFLRAPRFQDAGEHGFLPGGLPVADHPPGQIICLYCHSKPGWDNSTHDVSQAVHNPYPVADDPGTSRPEDYDFDGTHTVAQYACRNCHDPHTAQGAKRLHKEGVTVFGGADAIENTCFMCHSPNKPSSCPTLPCANPPIPAGDPTTDLNPRFVANGQRVAPNIYTEFSKDSAGCQGGVGSGSAMCLQLASGHEPVIISRSQEGVQLHSEGVALTPVSNEQTPGVSTPDVTHVECVDCHNPHQVNSPNSASVSYNGAPNVNPPGANGQGARLKGAKGVGIDSTGTRPVVVSRCQPGYVICGRDATINGTSANRDPYVYEVCFRCHGNSYEKMFDQASTGTPNLRNPDDVYNIAVPTGYASYVTIPYSTRTDPTVNGATGNAYSYRGFSNKWREFNPETDDVETPAVLSVDLVRYGQVVFSHTQQIKNPAYHPVVVPGRNGSIQLCNQLTDAFGTAPGWNCSSAASASRSLGNLTIQCTDCHNNNQYDAYNNSYASVDAYGAAGDTSRAAGGLRGPLTESNLRPTDVWPGLNAIVDYVTVRPTKPIGPHGSTNRRLLRANYDTGILSPGRCFEQNNPPAPAGCGSSGDGYSGSGATHTIAGGGKGSNNNHYQKFLLCFNCHDRRAFDPDAGSDQNRNFTRFFGLSQSAGGVDSWWNGNLHMYHLRWSGAMCHECHYNIHSNVEALNTIYGDGHGGSLADDSVDGMTDGVKGTHLINFGPQAEGTTAQKPMWFYDGSAFRCYLRCHNEVMDSCAYQAPSTGTPNARWCAGGRNPGTSG